MKVPLSLDTNSLVSSTVENQHVRYATFSHEKDETPQDAVSSLGTASLWSRLFFSYANPLMRVGNARPLEFTDLWDLEADTCAAGASWRTMNDTATRSSTPWSRCMAVAFFSAALYSTACTVLAPVVLHHVVTACAAPALDVDDLGAWLGLFFASKLVNALAMTHMRFDLERMALRLTVSLKALLIRKAMRRSVQSKQASKTVDISNLFTSDVENLLWAAFELNNLWIVPIQLVGVVFLLYTVIDLAAFAGLAVLAASMLVSFLLAKLSGATFEDLMKHKDDRMEKVKEVVHAIHIVKLNAWEDKVAVRIQQLRATELAAIQRFMYLEALNIFVLWGSPLAVSAVSLGVYALVMEQEVTAAKVFTAIALFNVIRDPLRDLPTLIQTCIQSKVSFDRFNEYLALDEFVSTNVTRDDAALPATVALLIRDGTFGWTTNTTLFRDINLTIERGDLVIIHGAVGSGKSSLCSIFLGELHKRAGHVFVRGRVAYYSQEPWIQNMTIRANILFGLSYDPEKYARVISACGLLPDLHQLPGGDATEIGQQGVNLSGGQKARVCLARAGYADADTLLLDSPLAAVDAIVQTQIFRDCICNLLAKKTVVLVTHNADLIASDAANVKVLVHGGELTVARHDVSRPRSSNTHVVSPSYAKDDASYDGASRVDINDENAGRLVHDEGRAKGHVSNQIFSNYFDSLGGWKVCSCLFVVQTLWQVFQIGSDLWLTHWTSTKETSFQSHESILNLTVYSILGAAAALMVLVRATTVAIVGLRASRHLFDHMTMSLLKAPLGFFDSNPIGRIVNRYGDDMSAVDFILLFAFGNFLALSFFTACQLATAVCTINWLGACILPLVWIYVRIAQFYLAPSRELSRMWKVSSSPVLSHVTQSEEGAVVIRAFGQESVNRMLAEHFVRNDVNSQCWYAETVTAQWFTLRMQLLGCGVVFLVVAGLVYLRDLLSLAMVGLAFTYALSVDSGLASLVQSWSWVEIQMVSPERILEYASIPAEGCDQPLVLEPPASWSRSSTIEFQDVVFSYKQGGAPVLKGLSFRIRNNEKIGIVGRTGAGKSSLTMALFRIHELVSGRILIDGIDIATMPLRSLRTHVSIIPQSPVLFKGALRAYMDPFDEFTDAAIWAALDKVDMKAHVSALEGQLVYELQGDNFSVGERQLLCMARALLTQCPIVVMDEATTSMDQTTETKLEQMIHDAFHDATVLTIAHRLGTVMHANRILVLSDGRVLEFDRPRTLLKNEKGAFYALAKEAGYVA
ncbi:hypothetical protein PsorP6_011269 [Peronosclerospora sorghi]|uniref:Uncharacterized protein n=1 Tax=Peronosclerospora sorghi TaxID=230839 RepID=A0ACC0WJ55_9STRA|nr:hypothetical protein PsorP6_011269 [Peronosclerospora sorghi]